ISKGAGGAILVSRYGKCTEHFLICLSDKDMSSRYNDYEIGELKLTIKPFTGQHCESTATGTLLNQLGIELSEPMLFGLGEGLGFIIWKMKSTTSTQSAGVCCSHKVKYQIATFGTVQKVLEYYS
ncbi:MAG: BtrH N-terminal domain-containing protein, partial [Treponema sp.]|uniref:BtrH N-terminal domain-containing protein n=2 Tax=Treponema sp. TaxID=166 RepID=UPI003FA1B35C